MSTTSPKRKPSRMPCFTQALTRQPVGDEGSGSAARTLPNESSSRKRRNTSRASSRDALLPCSNKVVTRSASVLMNPEFEVLQHADDFLACGGTGRNKRQPVGLLEQSHRGH